MKLRESLSRYWKNFQTNLFPKIEEEVGTLTPKLIQVIHILEIVRVESHVQQWFGSYVGRPL